MPTHFANLSGACTLPAHEFQTAARIVNDVVRCQATGVIHGNAGTGKTFAVQSALEGLETDPTNLVSVCSLTFPSRPGHGYRSPPAGPSCVTVAACSHPPTSTEFWTSTAPPSPRPASGPCPTG